MKTYIGKISRCLLVMFVILFSSCEDILETLPSDRISSEVYWKNEQDAAYAANAIYNYLNGTRIFVFDGMTDILHANTQFSDYARWREVNTIQIWSLSRLYGLILIKVFGL